MNNRHSKPQQAHQSRPIASLLPSGFRLLSAQSPVILALLGAALGIALAQLFSAPLAWAMASLFAGAALLLFLRQHSPVAGKPLALDKAEAECMAAVLETFEKLVEDPQSSLPFESLLQRIERDINAIGSAIFLDGDDQPGLFAYTTDEYELDRYANVINSPQASEADHATPLELSVLGRRYALLRLGREPAKPPGGDFSAANEGQESALLLAELPAGQVLSKASRTLLEGLSVHLGHAITSARRARLRHRRDLHQERAAIARELHDSLAQSLSYLKIQAARLEAQLKRDRRATSPDYPQLDAISTELRQNLNLAYSQLRELMTTFRLTMNGRTLTHAIEESLEEFRSRSGIVFDSDLRIDDDQLSAHEELQVLHIIREGLANIVRHSNANRASVSLRLCDTQTVALSIRDNGVGIDDTPNLHQHHGMMIMQERARVLHGTLIVNGTLDTGGTLIEVNFPPQLTASKQQGDTGTYG